MGLRQYQRKRDFSRTREPRGSSGSRSAKPIFVVQLHHARRRHFDFRLQVGGVLKSWAIPKGPSFDPDVKRLAVEVEDHPLEYASFEGDIPEGHYGAGHVDRVDTGNWQSEGSALAGLKKGHLSFELFGGHLKGRWHLVRSHRKERQPVWFLIKADDRYAGAWEVDDLLSKRAGALAKTPQGQVSRPRMPEEIDAGRLSGGRADAKSGQSRSIKKPALAKIHRWLASLDNARKRSIDNSFLAPQLARLVDKPPAGRAWLHEVKWDGYRLLACIAQNKVQLWSRNQVDWNRRVPDILHALASLGLRSARLDGELIALDSHGHSDFGRLQQALAGDVEADLRYMLFDIPYLEGYDLSEVPLVDRKTLLEFLVEASGSNRILFSAHAMGEGQAIFNMAIKHELEGIVSKRADARYEVGRGDSWRKVKRLVSDEFAIVGFTEGQGSRVGFGALLLGRPSTDGGWEYAGRVGTGFSDRLLGTLTSTLKRHEQSHPSVHEATIDPLLRGAHWVNPHAVVEVYFRGVGNSGLLRQPSLKAMREDKLPGDLRKGDRAGVKGAKAMQAPEKTSASSSKGIKKSIKTKSPTHNRETITITHPDREVYPDEGITKQDVADYYQVVMDHFLPEVIGRPVSVIRCPSGVGKVCFFQKHAFDGLKHTPHARLLEESGQSNDYIYIDSPEAVIELVQFGALEFHPWGSTIKAPDHADRMIFDLDPAPDVSWGRVISAARRVRMLLRKLGLTSFVRTTGGKGLHLVVPIQLCAWDYVKFFAHGFAQSLAEAFPDEFIAVATRKKRDGLIFVDYLRNARGATSVASYSLRSREGAPVAAPLRWDELGKTKNGAAFNIHTMRRRLSRLRKDPWEGFDQARQDLSKLSFPEIKS